MTDPTFAEATARKLEEQERELEKLRLLVKEQAHTIRAEAMTIYALQEQNRAQQLRIQRLQLTILQGIDAKQEQG